jgi:hypothetical protein
MSDGTEPVLDVVHALDALGAAVDTARRALAERLWQVPEAELPGVLDRLHGLGAQVGSMKLTVVREVETRAIPAAVGATSLRAYLARRLRVSPKLAGDWAKLSESLATRYADVGAALAAGRIGYEQAQAIAETLDGLPSKTTFEQREWAQEFLLAKAPLFDARDLRALGKHLDNRFDPDGRPDREESARKKRGLQVRDNHDGTQTLRWTDTDENMAHAKAALDALAKPLAGEDGERDPRPAEVRRADALAEAVRLGLDAGTIGVHGGVRPHLFVTFTAEAMRGEPGAPPALTSTGDHLSPSVLQRLLCDASLTGILVDGDGVPLKMGRTKRTATPHQRAALTVRDGGCVFPGCTRPASWCQAHHFPEWAEDGATDLDKMCLLCVVHHHYVHDKGWRVRLGRDGHVDVIPPAWVDVLQRPRRNWHWQWQRDPANAEPCPDRGP